MLYNGLMCEYFYIANGLIVSGKKAHLMKRLEDHFFPEETSSESAYGLDLEKNDENTSRNFYAARELFDSDNQNDVEKRDDNERSQSEDASSEYKPLVKEEYQSNTRKRKEDKNQTEMSMKNNEEIIKETKRQQNPSDITGKLHERNEDREPNPPIINTKQNRAHQDPRAVTGDLHKQIDKDHKTQTNQSYEINNQLSVRIEDNFDVTAFIKETAEVIGKVKGLQVLPVIARDLLLASSEDKSLGAVKYIFGRYDTTAFIKETAEVVDKVDGLKVLPAIARDLLLGDQSMIEDNEPIENDNRLQEIFQNRNAVEQSLESTTVVQGIPDDNEEGKVNTTFIVFSNWIPVCF